MDLSRDLDFREFIHLTDLLDKDLRDAESANLQAKATAGHAKKVR